ncbi:MAG: hypothetical protein KGQ49_06575 [Verrucomicrobia bacterium]|nr:hypothetical protein [Verrucomicrobiota bacterium]MDE3047084.1 hypothetical protein [Verrucomicrobiota bacterium]
MYLIALVIGGFILRKNIVQPLMGRSVDTSGHVLIQMGYHIYNMKYLQALGKTGTPTQIKTLMAVHACWAATDAVWMFNTSAFCHSVADVVAAVACTSVVFAGVVACECLCKAVVGGCRAIANECRAIANECRAIADECRAVMGIKLA